MVGAEGPQTVILPVAVEAVVTQKSVIFRLLPTDQSPMQLVILVLVVQLLARMVLLEGIHGLMEHRSRLQVLVPKAAPVEVRQ